ncbi:hypothetical protein [Pseudoduganella dura]|uniref:hypothetical protein n=1 Tax=Pseudoduganella dura TaxID=321982 RepID=UPI0019853937|nr:hypothetical protein [Pseudoduganella dura]GGY21072.1 hypothetical protein GCM10007386_57430 [Pseudoduganella dura]
MLRTATGTAMRGGLPNVLRSGAKPTVTVERIDERHVAQLREEPEVRVVAPSCRRA